MEACSQSWQANHKAHRVQAHFTAGSELANLSSQPPVSLHPSSHSLPPLPPLLPFPAIRPSALRWWLELVQGSTFRPHGWPSWSTLWVRQGHVTSLTNQSIEGRNDVCHVQVGTWRASLWSAACACESEGLDARPVSGASKWPWGGEPHDPGYTCSLRSLCERGSPVFKPLRFWVYLVAQSNINHPDKTPPSPRPMMRMLITTSTKAAPAATITATGWVSYTESQVYVHSSQNTNPERRVIFFSLFYS